MGNINCTVTAGKVFTEDADGKVQVTPDGLNLLGVPTVTVNLDAAMVPSATLTTSGETANVRTVTVQLTDAASTNQAVRFIFRAWLSRSQYAFTAAGDAVPNGTVSWTTGTAKELVIASYYVAKQHWEVMTTAAGLAVLSVEHTATDATGWYLHVELDGRLYVSGQLIYA